MPPARFSAPLAGRRRLADNRIELLIRRPEGFDFEPGQRIRLYHEDVERDYSLASAPAEPELRQTRLAIVKVVATVLESLLDLLGIPLVEQI